MTRRDRWLRFSGLTFGAAGLLLRCAGRAVVRDMTGALDDASRAERLLGCALAEIVGGDARAGPFLTPAEWHAAQYDMSPPGGVYHPERGPGGTTVYRRGRGIPMACHECGAPAESLSWCHGSRSPVVPEGWLTATWRPSRYRVEPVAVCSRACGDAVAASGYQTERN